MSFFTQKIKEQELLKKKEHELHMVDAVGDCDQIPLDRKVGKVTLHIVNALLDILSFRPGLECKRQVTKMVVSHPSSRAYLPGSVFPVKLAKACTEYYLDLCHTQG